MLSILMRRRFCAARPHVRRRSSLTAAVGKALALIYNRLHEILPKLYDTLGICFHGTVKAGDTLSPACLLPACLPVAYQANATSGPYNLPRPQHCSTGLTTCFKSCTLEAMELASDQVLGFLSLPSEIRFAIYRHLYDGSTIQMPILADENPTRSPAAGDSSGPPLVMARTAHLPLLSTNRAVRRRRFQSSSAWSCWCCRQIGIRDSRPSRPSPPAPS